VDCNGAATLLFVPLVFVAFEMALVGSNCCTRTGLLRRTLAGILGGAELTLPSEDEDIESLLSLAD
jgi:hypothetical protein